LVIVIQFYFSINFFIFVKMQYLDKETLFNNIKISDIDISDLISADTYNETEMLNIYNKYKDSDKSLIFKAACQIAIIGYGNKNYGSIRSDQENVVKLTDLFDRLKIKYNERLSAKYEPGTLSARRLTRLFRYQIKLIIEKHQRPSYLWLKYSNKDKTFMSICFPGGEHLVENKNEAEFMMDTYMSLDMRLGTKFVDRLKRVFIARGILAPLEVEEMIDIKTKAFKPIVSVK